MNEHSLTPTYSGSHAPAKQLLQARAVLKGLLNQKDIRVLTDSDDSSDWVVGAPRNSAADYFLHSLDIEEWDIEQLVKVLEARLKTGGRFDARLRWVVGPDKRLLEWMGAKTDKWHQVLYAIFHRELKHLIYRLKKLHIVRLSTSEYRVGAECYFPTEGVQEDSSLPRVAMRTYTSGRNKAECADARSFLESVGVREVGEYEQVEAILKQRYVWDAKIPTKRVYEKDLRRFISLVQENPKRAAMFSDYYILEREDRKWACPRQVYLDAPYLDTGLHAFYRRPSEEAHDGRPVALAGGYLKIRIAKEVLVDFARVAGARTRLPIKGQKTHFHPNAHRLQRDYHRYGVRRTHTAIDTDWTISDLESVLENSNETLSRLIWTTMMAADEKILKAQFRPNRQYETRTEPSSLVLALRKLSWVPQRGGEFVRPAEASQDRLPKGFIFNPESPWIAATGFGEESAKRIEERRKTREMAKELGFDDDDALNDARRFAELPSDRRRSILAQYEIVADLPNREPNDRKRRAERVRERARDAPERTTETRTRSVSVNRDAVKREKTDPYLLELYTNSDGVTICQVCKQALPFKLADGSYYFEAVEFLPGLKRHHHQNYLALCPNHAAMYKHVNGSMETMKDAFLSLDGNELEVVLAEETATVYFSSAHLLDLKVVIEAEETRES